MSQAQVSVGIGADKSRQPGQPTARDAAIKATSSVEVGHRVRVGPVDGLAAVVAAVDGRLEFPNRLERSFILTTRWIRPVGVLCSSVSPPRLSNSNERHPLTDWFTIGLFPIDFTHMRKRPFLIPELGTWKGNVRNLGARQRQHPNVPGSASCIATVGSALVWRRLDSFSAEVSCKLVVVTLRALLPIFFFSALADLFEWKLKPLDLGRARSDPWLWLLY